MENLSKCFVLAELEALKAQHTIYVSQKVLKSYLLFLKPTSHFKTVVE
jgi:hypothetical protein